MFGISEIIRKVVITASITFVSFNAQAALTAYNSAGVDVVYSSVSDVTWTKDGNLFKTLYAANNNLVNEIAVVTQTYQDPVWGEQTIDESDFLTSSGMSWWGANAFANYLSSIRYGNSDGWRLASAGEFPIDDFSPHAADSEMSQLYYTELGRRSWLDYYLSGEEGTYGILDNNSSNMSGDAGPFVNVVSGIYWANEDDPAEGSAWVFNARTGSQLLLSKRARYFAWFVTEGQISAIPEPESYGLFLAGLGLLGVTIRRNKQA